MDDIVDEVIVTIHRAIHQLNNSVVDQNVIRTLLVEETYALDVFRLFLDISQDVLLNTMKSKGIKGDFKAVRNKCRNRSEEIAEILVKLGLIDAIEIHLDREWKLEDILFERYKQMRGSAMHGQHRGYVLEDAIEAVLKEINEEMGTHYAARMNFISHSGKVAKSDFMIPSHKVPKIIIESKAYEATGSKLTDVLGDIL
ncbi:MAG: hypothetical protein ACXQT4_05620 [Methanotrichaceae archaeon]